ncbi:MAG: response regulator [Myxococcales bacterium]|nr:response regulator [Myxococcales bacterium]
MSDAPVRILVADDEPGMREGCRKILVAEGYAVETAADGVEALEVFERHGDISVVLVDLKMPRLGGMELIEAVRQRDPDVVLLVITAYAAINTAVEATKRGAFGYIPKPFLPDELLLRVRNGLEMRALTIEARRLREERERRLLEVAAERTQSRTIIDCMTDGVLVVNRDRQIVLRNAAARRLMPEIAGIPLPAELETIESAEVRAIIDETLAARTEPQIAIREIPLGSGTYMVNASPVLGSSGESYGAVAVLRDITALTKLAAAKSMFVSMVAHEVKSPLAAIESYLNLLLSGTGGHDPERDRRMLERCMVRAKTLRTMVSELISLVAVETGKFSLKRSPLDVGAVVAEVVDAYKDRAAEKNIQLTLATLGSAQTKVLADREAIRSVFNNLVDNALKYTPAGGQVRVAVSLEQLSVCVSVRDTGIGMSPEERSRVFDDFYRAKNEFTANVPGTGLGLSLVKKFVELHQGTVTVQSEPGQGSEFTVRLPVGE